MKYWISILVVMFIISCKNSLEMDVLTSEAEADTEANLVDFDDGTDLISYEGLAEQKLQEYIELTNLIKDHPEFGTDIEAQLYDIASATLLPKEASIDAIENVRRLAEIETAMDSIDSGSGTVQLIPLSVEWVGENFRRTDTVVAVIQTDYVYIDGQEVPSKKISLEPFPFIK